MKTKLLLTAVALFIITASLYAQGYGHGDRNGNGRCGGRNNTFIDNNKNGICDNFENRSDTTKARTGAGIGKVRNFVDNNKNGVCDNFETRTGNTNRQYRNGNCRGYGRGNGYGKGNGIGRNFVDKNNNGICDFRENLNKQ
ncbi:MAG: hypothetical protein U0W24_08100 [Bacteroidales bacterium]